MRSPWHRLCAAVLAVAALAVAAAAARHDYNLVHVTLRLAPNFATRSLRAEEDLTFRPLRDDFRVLALDSAGPVLDAATMNGQPLRWTSSGELLFLHLPAPVGPAATLTVSLRYHLSPTAGLVFFPADLSAPNQATWLWASGEPNENHHWLPIYDRPDDKVTADFYIAAPPGDWAIANGALVARRPLPNGGEEFHWALRRPISTYLLTFYVGRWNRVDDLAPGKPPIQFDVPPDQSALIARARYGRTRAMMRYFAALTGVPFPWAKYDEVDNPGFFSGLENASATEFPGNYPQNATLADVRAAAPENDVEISHELSHQWFGDLVTCQDWSDLWLNEGFATFMETVWDSHANGRDAGITTWESDAAAYFRQAAEGDHSLVNHNYGDPWNQFDPVTYDKGGWALRMLRARLGDAPFWRAIHLYLERYSFAAANTENFELTLEASTHQYLHAFFQRWFYGQGFPAFRASWSWRPSGAAGGKSSAGTAVLSLRQPGGADTFLYTGPLVAAFWVAGRELRVSEQVAGAKQEFSISLPAKPEMVLLDPDHVLLKQLQWTKPAAEWAYQAAHAPWTVDREAALDMLALQAKGGEKSPIAAWLELRARSDKSPDVVADALDRLAGLAPAAARDLALADLANADAGERAAAAKLLGRLSRGEPATASEIAALNRVFSSDPVASARAAALAALLRLDRAHAVQYLARALAAKSYRWQEEITALRACADAVGKSAALPVLESWAAADRPPAARAAALTALGAIGAGDPRVLALERAALAGPLGDTQVAAAFALARLGDRASYSRIQSLAQTAWVGFFRPDFAAAAAGLR